MVFLLRLLTFLRKANKIIYLQIENILHVYKTVLIFKKELWIKIKAEDDKFFCIYKNLHHGAKISEMVGKIT